MKLEQALKKNFKLLFRSKETAFTIIFGPLLIILLVGFAFSGDQEINIALGVHAEDNQYTELADGIIQTLQENYDVNIWATEAECLEQVQIGVNHMCILFPADFEVREQHTNVVAFNVDPSRINLVYQVIDELGREFELQRQELSLDLTGNILSNLDVTRGILKEQIENIERAELLRAVSEDLLSETDGKLETTEMNFSIVDLRLVRGSATSIEQDVQQLYDIGIEQLDAASAALRDFENDCDDCANETKEKLDQTIKDFDTARDEFNQIYDDSPDKLQDIYRLLDDATARIDSIEENYETVQTDAGFVRKQIDGTISSLSTIKKILKDVKANLNYAHELLTGTAIADSETIVTPIKTTINEVTNETGNLTFTYPYILMLVIMFMGLMLGSTLIVTDKNSKAAFRNFTTSTRDEFHIIVNFLTTLLILLAQVAIILLFSYFFVAAPLLSNLLTTLLIILIAITLFSFIGMMVGFLAHSQEAAMITSLTIGSVMLFVSNLVIPTEGMKAFVRLVANINPYVLLSEMLKKSMLFETKIGAFGGRLLLVIILVLVFVVLIFSIQQYVRKRYFRQQATLEVKTVKHKAKPLVLDQHTVKNEFELLTALDLMTRKEFSEHVTDKKNSIHQWVLNELQNKKLAAKLKTTNKERMILKLDKYLKKQTKKQTKK